MAASATKLDLSSAKGVSSAKIGNAVRLAIIKISIEIRFILLIMHSSSLNIITEGAKKINAEYLTEDLYQ
jgi:hypothetical protein